MSFFIEKEEKMEKEERIRYCGNCRNCHYYTQKMCIHRNPQVERKQFGFPFRYNPNKINCQSYETRTIDDDISWEHM